MEGLRQLDHKASNSKVEYSCLCICCDCSKISFFADVIIGPPPSMSGFVSISLTPLPPWVLMSFVKNIGTTVLRMWLFADGLSMWRKRAITLSNTTASKRGALLLHSFCDLNFRNTWWWMPLPEPLRCIEVWSDPPGFCVPGHFSVHAVQ